MTKSRTLRKAGAVVLSLAMAFSVAGVAPSADAAAKKPALSAKKGTITVGNKKAVKIKNTTAKKVKKLVVSSNKKAVATVKKNSKVKFTVTGIKSGTAKITAKVTLKKAVAKKKVYTLKYTATVKKAATTPTEAPVQTVEPTPTVEPTATPEVDLAITAEQIGASKIKVTSNNAIALTDKVTVKRGSSSVDCTFTLDDETGKTLTVTTGAKLAEAEYEVTVTPADTKKKAASAKFVGKAAKLTKIDFVGTNLVLKDATFNTAAVKIFGYNDFDEKVALASLTPYTTKGTVKYDASSNEITVSTIGTGTMFQSGESVTITAIYQDGTNVQQVSKALTVSAMASVAKLEFGELQTTNTALKGKPITINNMKTGTYYKTVKAEDQYGNALSAKDLNGMVYSSAQPAGTFFVTPNQAAGSYVFLESFDTDTKNNVIAHYGLGALAMPGKQTFTFTSVGGFTATDTIEIVDNPFIAELNVTAPEMYGGKAAELSISAKDQDGNVLDLFNYVEKTVEIDQTAATVSKDFEFTDVNNTTKAHSKITVPAGMKLVVKKNVTKKTVTFTVTPKSNTGATNVTYILVVQSAKPAVSNVTCVAQTDASPYSISNKLKTSATNGAIVRNGDALNMWAETQLLDQYGASYAYVDKALAASTPIVFAETTTKVTTSVGAPITAGNFIVQVLDSTGALVTTPTAITAKGKYTVELWTRDTASANKKLDSKEFTLTVADTKYSNYKAELSSTDKLLYVGGQTDTETIKVTATDSTGTPVTLKPGEDYTIALDDVKIATAGTAGNAVASVGTGSTANVITSDTTDYVDRATATADTTGDIVANVYVGSEIVTSVKVPYSNAAPKTASYVAKKGAAGNTWTSATNSSIDLDDGIEISGVTGGTYKYTGATKGAQELEFKDAANVFMIRAVDQYGLSNFTGRLGQHTNLTSTSSTNTGLDYGDVTLSGTLTKSFKLAFTNMSDYTVVPTVMKGTPSVDATSTATGTNTLGTAKTMVVKGVKVYDQHGNIIANDDNTIMLGALSGTYTNAALTSAATNAQGELTLTVTSDASTAPIDGQTAIFTVGNSKITITYVTAGASAANTVALG